MFKVASDAPQVLFYQFVFHINFCPNSLNYPAVNSVVLNVN